MREQSALVIQRLTGEVERGRRIVISSIIYAEMRYGQIGKKA
jgi:tRNA(fMet)-specific endonuclease VapC